MSRASSPRLLSGGFIAVDAVATRSGRAPATRAEDVSGRHYVVARWLDHWRVTYEDTPIGAFDDLAEATRFACDVARIQAEAGPSTTVEVQAAVLERHAFVSIAAGGTRPPGLAR